MPLEKLTSCLILPPFSLQVAQRWRFASTPLALRKQGTPQVLPSARLSDVASQLAAKSYQVFLQDGQLYAFKGLAGRLGPIGVHIALLMCLAGGDCSSGRVQICSCHPACRTRLHLLQWVHPLTHASTTCNEAA